MEKLKGRLLWKPQGQVKDNTKFDLKQVGCKIVDRNYLAEECPMKEQQKTYFPNTTV
jgi:hypothetical protein